MKITIDPLAERRLWALIRAKDVEVGGMGYATLQEDGSIHWYETFLIPQEVSSSEVDFETTHGDQIAIERAIEDGVLDDPNHVWVNFHSHHKMSAYWSSTDDARIAAMHKVGMKRLLSFVGCHDGTYEMRFDLFDVEAHGVHVPQVIISKLSLTCEPDEFEQQIEAELEENVKEKKYTYTYTPSTSYNGKNGKKSPTKSAEEEDEKRIVSELKEREGYSDANARSLLDNLGIDDCELLLDGGFVDTTKQFTGDW